MKYPTLAEIPTARQTTDVFSGYNHNLRINDGEFFDMKNLTSTYYPVLSPRGKRGEYVTVKNPLGMIAKDTLCYVDDGVFYIGENMVEGLELTNEPKNLVSIGAYVVILPDKKWVNTAVGADGNYTHGSIEATFENGGAKVTFTLCKVDGSGYDIISKGDTAPEDAKNGQLWLDTSKSPHSLRVYSGSKSTWTSVATTYIKIQCDGIGENFEIHDGINISGLEKDDLINDSNGKKVSDTIRDQLFDINGSAVVWDKGDDYIVVIGILDEEVSISNELTITRAMPALDFVIESENRLWGCRYGLSNNGKFVNEIYASKQGDFKNWNCFMGVSTDSYVASCGTDGPFTGAITHLGYPLFMKENFMHKVYGNYPANYQIQTTACRGVQKGCEDSLAIVNEVLYYKSRSGVMAYDGSLPMEASRALGDVLYDSAVAAGHGNKYYISMRDASGEYHLFVHDTAKGLWHREDNTQVAHFCSCQNELYFIEHNGKSIRTIVDSKTSSDETVEWMAETGVIGVSTPDKKYISRLNISLSMAVGSRVYIYIQYDSVGEWEQVASLTGTVLRTFSVPIRTKRSGHMRLRITGVGEAKIYSIVKTIEQGSDIR